MVKFISCSDFPNCRYTETLLEKIGIACPQDGGDIVQRKTRKRADLFWGVLIIPPAILHPGIDLFKTPCPNCGGLLVIKNKNEAQCIKCQESILMATIAVEEEQTA